MAADDDRCGARAANFKSIDSLGIIPQNEVHHSSR